MTRLDDYALPGIVYLDADRLDVFVRRGRAVVIRKGERK